MSQVSPNKTKNILLIIIVPLFLGLWGQFQLYRVNMDDTTLAEITNTISYLKQEQKNAKNPKVLIKTDTGEYSASSLISTLEKNKIQFISGQGVTTLIGKLLAKTTILLSFCAVLVGLWGLITVKQAGKKALHSREALLDGFQKGLKKLPWLIGSIGFLITLSLTLILAFELMRFAAGGIKGSNDGKLIFAGLLLMGLLVFFNCKLIINIYRASKNVFELSNMRLMGTTVTEAQAPKVWDFIKEIAHKAGATMPDHIVLGLDEGFFVTEHPVELLGHNNNIINGRILYLPLPYMAFMTKPEAAAVIGHELGHFTGADTEYSLRFSPIYSTAINNLRAVALAAEEKDDNQFLTYIAKPALSFGEYYLDSFYLAVQHWSREREFAADKMGALIGGNEGIALSLLRISALAPHVHTALSECWQNSGKLEGGVLAHVRSLVKEHGLEDPAIYLEETQAHPTDSHPPTSQRLAAVKIAITQELFDKVRSVEESDLLNMLGIETAPDSIIEEVSEHAGEAKTIHSAEINLSTTLEQQFSQAAQENVDTAIEELQKIASSANGRKDFFECPTRMVVFYSAISLALIVLSSQIFLDGKRDELLPLLLFSGVSLLCFYNIWKYTKRKKKPFLTINEQGFLVGDMEESMKHVPWDKVDDYYINTNSIYGFRLSITIEVILEKDYTPPALTGDKRIKFIPKKQTLAISVKGIARPYKVDGFAETLHQYWHAHLAKMELNKIMNSVE